MNVDFKQLPAAVRWAALSSACQRVQRERGYKASRVPGSGNANIWVRVKHGQEELVAYRTSQDRWLAFAPMGNGSKWKTLSDVAVVTLAVVDNRDNPAKIQVYDFPADEVRKRFDSAYKARAVAGNQMRDGWGMWVNLETDTRDLAIAVGSGLVADYPMIAEYPIEEMLASASSDLQSGEDDAGDEDDTTGVARATVALTQPLPATIAEVMRWARERVAALAGVRIENVKLELKVEY